MIIAGTLMLSAPMSRVRLVEGWLRLDAGRIVEVTEGECPHTPDLGGDASIITPGFVDTHLHLPQFDAIGAEDLTLLKWLDQVIYPAEAMWADPDHAADATARAIEGLLRCGTTTFAAYTTVHHDATRRAIEVAAEKNIRAAIGQTLSDQIAPDDLIRPTQQLLDETAALFDAPAPGRIQPVVTPRFAVTCTADLLRGCADIADQHHALIQTHLAETQKECQAVYDLHDQQDYTDVYHHAGLLTDHTLLGHGIWLDAAARKTLARSQSVIAHCPTANTFLRSGTMDRHLHTMAHVLTCLGSDIGAGPDRAMPRVARAAIQAAQSLGRPPQSAAESFYQITTANADALHMPTVGRITPDAEADLLVIEPDLNWRDTQNPLGMILHAWDNRWIKHTLLEGAPV